MLEGIFPKREKLTSPLGVQRSIRKIKFKRKLLINGYNQEGKTKNSQYCRKLKATNQFCFSGKTGKLDNPNIQVSH